MILILALLMAQALPVSKAGSPTPNVVNVQGNASGVPIPVNCTSGCAGGSTTPTDAFANPTTAGLVTDFNMGWNGSTWDRLRVSPTSTFVGTETGLLVRVISQPASGGGLTDAQLRATPVPVSGTFWQATQPISGSVTVTQATGTNLHAVIDSGFIAVSGTSTMQGGAAGGAGALTTATVKAASTAAVATDTAVVVQIAPNQPQLTAALNVQDTADGTTGAAVGTIATRIAGGSIAGGTNLTAVTVKAASTAAAATDTALVTQALINNAAMVTSAAGVQRVGIAGNANATLDGAIGGAAPTNVIWNTAAPSTASAAALTTGFSVATGATSVKASAGNVYGVMCQNTNASVCWLNFFNSAPTCATTVPVWSVPLAANGVAILPPGAMALAQHSSSIQTCQTVSGSAAGAVCVAAMNCVVFYK